MDELTIDDKKYVSSKRAAKLTGYAKDYIGQLCREGRVSARLVGRSWYVLESAIHDHRFGESVKNEPAVSPIATTWEAPKYEAAEAKTLDIAGDEAAESAEPDEEATVEKLQDSWKAWFDRMGQSVEPNREEELAAPIVEQKQQETVDIPIRTIYDLPPRELRPMTELEPRERVVDASSTAVAPRRTHHRSIVLAGALISVISMTLAALGTGYFDTYIISNEQVSKLAGVILYNR